MQKQFNFKRWAIKFTIGWSVQKTTNNNWHIPLLYIAFGESFAIIIFGVALGIGVKILD